MTHWKLLVLLSLCLVFNPATNAKKLYKYQDAQGQWHFSDKPPQQGLNIETQQLQINQRAEKVSVVRRGLDVEPAFYIINEYRGPIELELILADSRNTIAAPELPKRFVVQGASEVRAAVLRPAAQGRPMSYDVRYRLMLGDPNTEHRPEKPYRAPFPSGRAFPISQGFHGEFSHNQPASEYAVDIGMPEGTPVLAARAGVVMDVAHDFFNGGDKTKYLDRANTVRILHDDGTMAVYGHLRLESARVSPGMRVAEGQVIAESGNTGYSTGPHLHFVVQKNAGMRLLAVPFQFEGPNGEGIAPEAGALLTAH